MVSNLRAKYVGFKARYTAGLKTEVKSASRAFSWAIWNMKKVKKRIESSIFYKEKRLKYTRSPSTIKKYNEEIAQLRKSIPIKIREASLKLSEKRSTFYAIINDVKEKIEKDYWKDLNEAQEKVEKAKRSVDDALETLKELESEE